MFSDSPSQSLEANPCSAHKKPLRHGLLTCFAGDKSENTAAGFYRRVHREMGLCMAGLSMAGPLLKEIEVRMRLSCERESHNPRRMQCTHEAVLSIEA